MTRMVLDHGGGLALVKEILDNLAILFLHMILYYCTKNSNVSAVNKRNAESGRSSDKMDEDRGSALEF